MSFIRRLFIHRFHCTSLFSKDVIDIVRDQLTGNDYKLEEDPCHYVSNKTGRGPLHDDWVTHPPNGVVMCAYKMIKVCWYDVHMSVSLKHVMCGCKYTV